MKKRYSLFILAVVVLVITITTLFIYNQKNNIAESIIYFPIDPNLQFNEAITQLKIIEQVDEDEYKIQLNVMSELNKTVYLRQDISLLYEDGWLKETFSDWKENQATLQQKRAISSEDSGHFEAISYHHAEIHYPNDIIKSAQKMSYDELYVIASPLHPLESFKVPESTKEKDEKSVLDHAKSQQLNYVWEKLIQHYNIPVEKYVFLPLTKLYYYNNHTIPNMSREQTNKAIGGLWEGLYKNYFLGIQISEDKTITPIGSSLPLVFIARDGTHIIVLTETRDGDKVQFIQYIE